ncbi:unnamed protein product [Diplocarpon coronariae]
MFSRMARPRSRRAFSSGGDDPAPGEDSHSPSTFRRGSGGRLWVVQQTCQEADVAGRVEQSRDVVSRRGREEVSGKSGRLRVGRARELKVRFPRCSSRSPPTYGFPGGGRGGNQVSGTASHQVARRAGEGRSSMACSAKRMR